MPRRLATLTLLTAIMSMGGSGALAAGCTELTRDPNVQQEQRIQDCVVQEAEQIDDSPWAWVSVGGGGAVLFGGSAAALLLRRHRGPERRPRTEDEAWSELLGEPG